MALTTSQCLQAKPEKKTYKLYDIGGLFLRVRPSGNRTWHYKYRIHGKEKCISFGLFPDTSLEEARDKRREALKQVEKGFDPLMKRAEEKEISIFKAGDTFKGLAIEWHNLKKLGWTERNARVILYRLDKYVFPKIGHFPITSLTPLLILSCVQEVEKTSPDIARRIVQHISGVFKYAMVTGRFDRDLTICLSDVMRRPKRGHVASIDIDELPDFLKALENDGHASFRQNHLAFKLMLLTFVRTKELLHAKWDEINFEQAMWTIPAERMKMNVEHLVPLSRQAIAILKELKELTGRREYIFPSIQKPRKPTQTSILLIAIRRMGYVGKMTGHGCRALAMGIIMERLHYPFEIVDRQLSHVPASEITKAYLRAKFIKQRTQMMQDYADYIDKQAKPKPQQRTINDEPNDTTTKYGFSSSYYGLPGRSPNITFAT